MFSLLLAQKEHPLGRLEGIGPLGETLKFARDIEEAMALFNKVLSIIIGVMTVVAGLWFIFQFLIGAFGWLTAGGDKTGVENARKKISGALTGLVLVIAAIFIVDLVGLLLGFDILRPGKFILDIWK